MERVDAQPTALTQPAWAAQQAWATAATAHKLCEHGLELATTSVTGF